MNIIDSSGWIEYFVDGKNAKIFSEVIENQKRVLVPTIIIYEIFKKFLCEYSEEIATEVVAHLKQCKVVELDIEVSLMAADISRKYKLPMADSIIYATAKKYKADLWTQDSDFRGMKGVKYFAK